MTTWTDFRTAVGERLDAAEIPFLKALAARVLDLDYEGPPVCGGEYQSLHAVWEELEQYAEEDGVEGAAEYVDQIDAGPVEDWAMNAYPGLCPKEVVREIRNLFGGC